jgi:hypothetical protein
MKTGLIFLLTGVFLIGILLFLTKPAISNSTVDIHLYDTLYVIEPAAVFLFSGLFMITLFFLGCTIETKFKNQIYLILLFVLLAADIYYMIRLTNPSSI